MSRAFDRLEGVAAPLPLANVDTDKIFPARFLTTVEREGLGAHLFHALRTDEAGAERPDFILNRAPWRDSVLLIAGDNFGCGSSREHAVWALADFGIRCIVAPSFADIFAGNCARNGVLTIGLDAETCARLIADASVPETARITADLSRQCLVLSDGSEIRFDIAPERKQRLLSGLDEIDATVSLLGAIEAHDAAATYPRPSIPEGVTW